MLVRVCSITFFLIIFSYTLFSVFRLATSRTQDFSIFYGAGRDVLHHTSPYSDKTLFTAFNYPLSTAVVFIPFALLPYVIAQGIFLFLNILAVFISAYVCLKMLQQKITLSSYLFIVSLVLLAFPTKFTYGMGQTNLLACSFLLAGFYFSESKKKTALLFFILSFFFKPILGFTFVVFFLQKKWQYFVSLIFVIIAIFISVPFFFGQPMANAHFFSLLTHQSLLGREVYYNQGLLGFVSRLTPNLQIRAVMEMLGGLGMLGLLGVLWKKHVPVATLLSLLLTLLVLIDPLSWQHHFVFLLFPFLWCFYALKSMQARVFLFVVFWISYLLVAGNIKTPDAFANFPLSFLLSNQFYGTCILLCLELVGIRKNSKG